MYKYEKEGKRHRKEKLVCQDVVDGEVRNGIWVLVAADGSSKNDFGRHGAERTVQTVKEFLFTYFEELYGMEEKDIQFAVMNQVRDQLYQECDEHGIGLDELKSTLLAVAYEKDTGKMIRLHLGDGYIVVKQQGRYRFHSYPDNGKNRYATYLTSMIPIWHRLHVQTKREEGVEEICLLTDGWLEIAGSDKKILELVNQIPKAQNWDAEDDLGYISATLI